MAYWWDGQPTERFWLEITRRDDVGEQLWHFVKSRSGSTLGQTTLLEHMRRGDIVFHYDAIQGAIVGRSAVMTDSASHTKVDGEDVIVRTIHRFEPFVPTIDLEALRAVDDAVMNVQLDLDERYGPPTWMPFLRWRGQLRPQNRYFAKFPAAMVPLIQGAAEPSAAVEPGREFDPSRPPTKGILAKPVDERQRHALQEKAKRDHHHLLAALAGALGGHGWTKIRETASIDLWAVSPAGRRVIFEAKTLSGGNDLSQSRAGLAQLLEYRALFGTPADEICLVVNQRLATARAALLESLEVPVLALQVKRFIANNPCAAMLSATLED